MEPRGDKQMKIITLNADIKRINRRLAPNLNPKITRSVTMERV